MKILGRSTMKFINKLMALQGNCNGLGHIQIFKFWNIICWKVPSFKK